MDRKHRTRGRADATLLRRGWSEAGLALILCASALALGGAHVTVVLLGTFAVAACGALGLASGSLRRVPAPALVLAALGVYSLVQSLPLPLGLLRVLSPSAAEAWSRSLLPQGEHVTFGSLSLDPGASCVEAAKWTSYAVAFAIAAAFSRRNGAVPALALVFFSALSVALATLAHGLVGATRVFGVYRPQLGASLAHVGPILNANTLAGYLILGVLCGVGFALSAKTTFARWLWATATAVLIGETVLAGSRGGFVALTVGIVALAVFYFKTRSLHGQGRRLKWYDWAGLGGALLAAIAFAFLGVQDAWFDLSQKDLSKLRMGAWVLPMLRDFPVFGVGRGAFESTFPFYKPTADNIVYANPENIVAQWLSEWGVVVGLLAFGSLLWLLRPSRVGFGRQVLSSAALIGVGAVALQNFVDFSFELFAPMLAAIVILASCWGQSQTRSSPRTVSQDRPRSASPVILVGLAFVCVGFAFARGRWPVSLERAALRSDYLQFSHDDEGSANTLWTRLRSAMQRHPAEPYFSRLGAVLALRTGKVEPLPWIERALERGPVDSRTHWILAQALNAHGFLPQALLEARLSVDYDERLAKIVGGSVAHWSPRREDIQRATPLGRAGSEVQIAAAKHLNPMKYYRLQEELLRAAVVQDPGFVDARRSFADQLLYGLKHELYPTDERSRNQAEVLREANALDRLEPESASGSEVRARLYALTGQADDADRELSARCPLLEEDERVKCWQALLGVGVARSRRVAERAAERLVKTACVLERNCEAALLAAGDAMRQLRLWPEALNYFQQAVKLEPRAQSLMKVAEAAAALGQIPTADRALEIAAGHARANPALWNRIQAQRQVLATVPQYTGRRTGSP